MKKIIFLPLALFFLLYCSPYKHVLKAKCQEVQVPLDR